MLYFIKDHTIHQFPVDKRCTAVHQQEQLRDTILRGVDQCPYCMREWPERKDEE